MFVKKLIIKLSTFVFVLFISFQCKDKNSVLNYEKLNSEFEKIFKIRINKLCNCTNIQKGLIDENGDWEYSKNVIIKLENCDFIVDSLIKQYSLKKISEKSLDENKTLFIDSISQKTVYINSCYSDMLLWEFKSPNRRFSFPKWWIPDLKNIKNNYANYINITDSIIVGSSIYSRYNGKIVIQESKKLAFIYIDYVGYQ
jgi:hypothetical protein